MITRDSAPQQDLRTEIPHYAGSCQVSPDRIITPGFTPPHSNTFFSRLSSPPLPANESALLFSIAPGSAETTVEMAVEKGG